MGSRGEHPRASTGSPLSKSVLPLDSQTDVHLPPHPPHPSLPPPSLPFPSIPPALLHHSSFHPSNSSSLSPGPHPSLEGGSPTVPVGHPQPDRARVCACACACACVCSRGVHACGGGCAEEHMCAVQGCSVAVQHPCAAWSHAYSCTVQGCWGGWGGEQWVPMGVQSNQPAQEVRQHPVASHAPREHPKSCSSGAGAPSTHRSSTGRGVPPWHPTGTGLGQACP